MENDIIVDDNKNETENHQMKFMECVTIFDKIALGILAFSFIYLAAQCLRAVIIP